jgi:uncharacterized protein (UPF0548 family)
MVLFIRRPTDPQLKNVYAMAQAAAPSYREVGATAHELPSGYRHDTLSVELGRGEDLFERCVHHLDTWGLQRSMGFHTFPEDSRVSTNATVLLTVPLLGVNLLASCRVIYTVDEPTRHGFAYGTLPTHPEMGEEYFGVSINDDVVRFELCAFSRPHAMLARLGGPITRQLQLAATRRYGENMQRFAAQ